MTSMADVEVKPVSVVQYTRPRDVMSFENRLKLAEMLVTTGFLPTSIKTPAQAVAIIQAGHELGIPPMYALRSIALINNRPTLSSELQLGLFHVRGGKHQWLESSDVTASIKLMHPIYGEHTETFTLKDAERQLLLSKDNWKKLPKYMLRARAISTGIRAFMPEVLAGTYSPDELGAEEYPDGEIVVLPEAIADTGKEDQIEYLKKILAVPVFSEVDKENYIGRCRAGESMAVLINEVLTVGKKRGAEALQQVNVEAQTQPTAQGA